MSLFKSCLSLKPIQPVVWLGFFSSVHFILPVGSLLSAPGPCSSTDTVIGHLLTLWAKDILLPGLDLDVWLPAFTKKNFCDFWIKDFCSPEIGVFSVVVLFSLSTLVTTHTADLDTEGLRRAALPSWSHDYHLLLFSPWPTSIRQPFIMSYPPNTFTEV